MSADKPHWKYLLLWIAPAAFLGLFYFYPLVEITRLSFSRASGGWAAPFLEIFQSSALGGVIWFTFWQALLSTFLTLLIGLPGAYLLARYTFPGKALLRAVSAVPFVLPTLVVAAAFSSLLGPRGWVNLALMEGLGLSSPPINFVNSLTAILVAHVFYNTTIVLRMVGDFWGKLDPRLAQAAQVLGATRWQAWRKITLPLLMPAVLAASLLVFIFDFTSFGVILVLGGPRFATLEIEIYNQTIAYNDLPMAAALSILQLAGTLGLMIFYTRLARRLSIPVSLRPQESSLRTPTGFKNRLLVMSMLGFLALFFTVPLLSLAARSAARLEPERGQHSVEPALTLDFYRQLAVNERSSAFFAPPSTAVAVSLGYASLTVILALALGFPAAWALARHSDLFASRVFDPILMLPLGTSAVTLGLGFIVALDQPPLNLRASPILIPLAHTLVAFPFVVRSLTPALRAIQPKLSQAAAVLGAPPRKVLRYIELPLVGRALLVSAAFAFAISLGEFGATALISRPEYPTVPVMIYRFISSPGATNYGQALALSTILMGLTAGAILLIERLRIAEVGEF